MNPNFHQDIQNNISQKIPFTNQVIPNHNLQNITIIKTEEQKQINGINTNYIQNNLEKNPQVIKETKIITQRINNPIDPQRFSFRNTSNLDIVSLENNNNNSYRQLIKKIANQLKRKVRPPTQGFFHFALQKGDYSLIIIRKISSQMRNHQIEFNNDIFRIYTQKLIKYRELIKRIAHLLKITMKNQKYFENLNNRLNTTVQTIEKKTIVQTNVNTSNNINQNNNISKNNGIKKASIKSEQTKLVGNNKNIVNQKKTKTQTISQTNINKSHINNKRNHNQSKYNTNLNQNKINPINPFFASKDKLSFNSNNTNMMKNNLQNQNQYFLHNKERTSVPNINNKSQLSQQLSQSININKNKSMINVNLSKQQKNINNNQNKVKMTKNEIPTNDINNNLNEVKIVKTEITSNNIITNNNNKKDISLGEIKPNVDLEVIDKEKIIMPHIEEKNVISNNKNPQTFNIIDSISNNNKDINAINNYDVSENRIFSKTPIISRFTDISNDIEMKDNSNNINILSDKNRGNSILNTSLVNTGTFQQIPKNNIEANKNSFINFEKKSISVNLVNNSIDKNKINNIESKANNMSNMSNMSMINNYNSDSNNNITISSLNKEEDKNSLSIGSNKGKGKDKQIKIELSLFKKDNNKSLIEEEKSIHSNMESQTININNIQQLNCNTFTENAINNDINNNDSIIYQKEISTYPDEASFLKKFDLFLIKNNISIKSFIPMAINNTGQQYLKQNAFWEKYINYIFINYNVNNIKISLFSFAHLIEQYFLWCENLSSDIVEGFKKLIIETISKIFTNDEINQFCTMNKINNFGDLFEKYKIFINTKKNGGFKYDKEIEIKIKNKDQELCNCELCRSEIACMKKLIEVNKNKIMGVNIENIFYDGNENKPKSKKVEKDENEDEEIYIKKTKKTYPPTKSRNSSAKKKSYPKFSASKIKESSGEAVEYIGKERSKSKKRSSSSKKRRQSTSRKRSSSSKKKRKNSSEKEEKKDEDMKIDTYFMKEIYVEEKKEENDTSKADKDNKKKAKNKKKEKSKSRSKSKEKKYEIESESEEKETKNKRNKKRQKSKNNKKEKKYSDSESEEEKIKTKDKKKKKQQYPKD